MSDAAGLVLGIPGLVQACVHAYRFIGVMMDLDKSVIVLRLKYRIEESRLILWGRFWGLIETGKTMIVTKSAQNLDDLLDIAGVQDLIIDILKQVLGLLGRTGKMSEKYEDKDRTMGEDSEKTTSETGPAETKPEHFWTRLKKHGATARFRWALKDKSDFESVLIDLTSLNDGLDKLLPRQDRVKMERAIVGEVLSEENIIPGTEQSDAVMTAFDRTEATNEKMKVDKKSQEARMISHHLLKKHSSSGSSSSSMKSGEENEAAWEESDRETLYRQETQLSKQYGGHSERSVYDRDETGKNDQDVSLSMQLPLDWFEHLERHTDGFSMTKVRLPSEFEPGKQTRVQDVDPAATNGKGNQASDIQSGSSTMSEAKDGHEKRASEETVFVEWRTYEHTIADEELQMALNARREKLSRLFRNESKADSHYVMQCLGFVLYDETTMGLVFRPPPNWSGPPISLNQILLNSYKSLSAVAPDLEIRVQLAKRLCLALYQLQCAGWLHRKISSHNILFFPAVSGPNGSDSSANVNLMEPFLVGWQTARYDDQVYQEHSEGVRVWRRNPFLEKELPYIHPSRPAAKLRFRRSFDVYALGIVLAEIAFWEPIDALNGSGERNVFADWEEDKGSGELEAFSQRVVSTCKTELAGEVGRHYESAVVWCLEGIKAWHAEQADARQDATKEELDREVGLEKAFFWNVLNQFDYLID